MKLFEFSNQEHIISVLATVLKNYISKSSYRTSPAKINYGALTDFLANNEIYVTMDYETFDAIFNSDEGKVIKNLTKNYDGSGIELNVPGVGKEKRTSDGDDSQDAVDQIAASNAEKNLS